jgi:hypothetical protein
LEDETESAHPAADVPSHRAPAAPAGERELHPAVQIGWVVGRALNAFLLGTAALVACAGLASRSPWLPPLLGLLAFVATLLLGLWHARRLFEGWRWELRRDDVVARYGVVWRVSRSIPRVRVQHVDVRSGPVDRALGLVEVSLHVAGSAGAVLTIPGLAPAEAEALREALLGSARVP